KPVLHKTTNKRGMSAIPGCLDFATGADTSEGGTESVMNQKRVKSSSRTIEDEAGSVRLADHFCFDYFWIISKIAAILFISVCLQQHQPAETPRHAAQVLPSCGQTPARPAAAPL